MTPSIGRAVKAAIITDLAALLTTIPVLYSLPRDIPRQLVYGGRIDMDQRISAGRTSAGDTTRDEDGTIAVHIRTRGTDAEAAEVAALSYGAYLEAYLAGTGPVVSGLTNAEVDNYELVSGPDDEGFSALLTYRIGIRATIQ